jgi:hypothetical protein
LINKKTLGPLVRLSGRLNGARSLVARALPRTSAMCATLCALIHCAWLQWRTSPPLWLLLATSHLPHSSTAEVCLSVADHRLVTTGHRRALSTPPQWPPVPRPSSRAASRRPPPQDVALTALFHCLCFASARHTGAPKGARSRHRASTLPTPTPFTGESLAPHAVFQSTPLAAMSHFTGRFSTGPEAREAVICRNHPCCR